MIVGEGAYGEVRRLKDNPSVVVKLHKESRNSDEDYEFFSLTEFVILHNIKHENVVSMCHYDLGDDYWSIYMIDGGMNLGDWICITPNLTPEIYKIITHQIVLGLDCIHRNGYIHGDIKPENILVRGNSVKIIDFGLSIFIGTGNKKINRLMQTCLYRAPEVFDRAKYYDFKIDVWSLGRLYIYMLDQSQESYFKNAEAICKNNYEISNGGWKKMITANHKYEDSLDDLISRMLVINPQNRANTQELLLHEYYSGSKQVVNKDYYFHINIRNLYDREKRHIIQGTYPNVDIMNISSEWIIDIMKELGVSVAVALTALQLFNDYINLNPHITKDRLQLYLCACMEVSIEFHRNIIISSKTYAYMTDNSYSPEEIRYATREIVNLLLGEISSPNALDFVRITYKEDSEEYNDCAELMLVSIFNQVYHKYLPSVMAENVIALLRGYRSSECIKDILDNLEKLNKDELKGVGYKPNNRTQKNI